MKLLIISWGVYPQQAAMSVIIHNLAKELGKDRVVVVGEESDDTAQWDEINYPLYYIKPYFFNIRKGQNKQKWLKMFHSIAYINNIVKQHQCTHILCPFPDEYYLSLAYFVSRSNQLPFYPWMHNTYLENSVGLRKTFAKYIQRIIFKSATTIFTISNGLTEYYEAQYVEHNFGTLLHCFNIPDKASISYEKKTKIKLALSGSFNASCSDAILRLCRVIVGNERFELHAFGKQMNGELKANGVNMNKVISYGFLSEEDFNKALQACDVMLLPHGFDGMWTKVEYETIFPTRTIPLLYSGKPILLHSPAWAKLTAFFEKHVCGFIVSVDDEVAIEKCINDIFENETKYNLVCANALKTAQMFDVKNVCKTLIEQIS